MTTATPNNFLPRFMAALAAIRRAPDLHTLKVATSFANGFILGGRTFGYLTSDEANNLQDEVTAANYDREESILKMT